MSCKCEEKEEKCMGLGLHASASLAELFEALISEKVAKTLQFHGCDL